MTLFVASCGNPRQPQQASTALGSLPGGTHAAQNFELDAVVRKLQVAADGLPSISRWTDDPLTDGTPRRSAQIETIVYEVLPRRITVLAGIGKGNTPSAALALLAFAHANRAVFGNNVNEPNQFVIDKIKVVTKSHGAELTHQVAGHTLRLKWISSGFLSYSIGIESGTRPPTQKAAMTEINSAAPAVSAADSSVPPHRLMQDGSMRHWRLATHDIRVRVATEIVAAYLRSKGIQQASTELLEKRNPQQLKTLAGEVEICISGVGKDHTADDQRVAEIGAVCMALFWHEAVK